MDDLDVPPGAPPIGATAPSPAEAACPPGTSATSTPHSSPRPPVPPCPTLGPAGMPPGAPREPSPIPPARGQTAPTQAGHPAAHCHGPRTAKAEPPAPAVAVSSRTTDRRAALTAHLTRPPAGQSPAHPRSDTSSHREAALHRSMRDLQQQCADLAGAMAEIRARQGPLVQRLHNAQAALTALRSSPSAAGTPAV